MKTSVSLRYKGPALDAGRMDVYDASSNMIAFSEFMVAVVKTTYGDDAEAKAEVAGFERGSFVTDLVINVGGAAVSVFAAFTPNQLWSIVREAFDLWKHLRGQPPTEVLHDSGRRQSVSVRNNSGQVIQVQTETLTLVMSERAATPAGRFVKQALEREGVDSLQIEGANHETLASVERGEASYFVPVASESIISDNTNRMAVSLVSPVFLDGNKWRFNDGASSFSAAIEDQGFLASVDRGERFGKGDVLDVDMRIVQTRIGLKMSVERHVIKVHRHITPHEQLPL